MPTSRFKLLMRLRALLPGSCLLCRRGVDGELDICPPCLLQLPQLGPACRQCGTPLDAPAISAHSCGRCQASPPPVARMTAPFRFGFPVDQLVRRFKFHGDLVAGQLLSGLLARHVEELLQQQRLPRPDALLAVPLHRHRQAQRGFNQSWLLASEVAARCGLPLLRGVLERTRDTPVQAGLDAASRRRNLRHAFVLRQPPPAGRIAIVDDVATTGSTLYEIARLLRLAGTSEVDAWVVARTTRA